MDGGGSFRSEPRREGGVVGLHGDSVPSVPALEVADGRTRANLAQHLENAAAAIFTPKSNAKTGCAWDAEPTADSLIKRVTRSYPTGMPYHFFCEADVRIYVLAPLDQSRFEMSLVRTMIQILYRQLKLPLDLI